MPASKSRPAWFRSPSPRTSPTPTTADQRAFGAARGHLSRRYVRPASRSSAFTPRTRHVHSRSAGGGDVAKDARRSGTQLERLASPLLRAKLRPPLVPKHHVRRTRLLRLLDDAVAARLTLVVAPAGVGKTVLVSSWIAESDVPTAWLTLDESDRDGRGLWSGMVAALEVLRPGCGEGALTVLRRSGPLSAVVHHLLEGLDSAGSPGVLVVDDVHLVDDDEALDSLARFLQHLPTWLHVVLLSRRELALPVDRLQA